MMAKKTSKKTQSQAETTEAPELQNDESAPPTIVESSESEVFEQTQEQADTTMEQPKEASVPEQVETTIQEKKQPAAKPLKPSKRPYIQLCIEHFELGDLDQKSLLELILKEFPSCSKGGVGTFLTDQRNDKYRHKDLRPVVKQQDGKLIFADKLIPAVIVAEGQEQTTEEPSLTDAQATEADAPAADIAPTLEEQPNVPGEQ